ncbi:hypothetical protein F7725_010496 [Dissostichus mawsoni]|uniref:Rho-GAP domain-containing protein n=1 Tax=Dissostichus mawsoni TaxID=36200 RepID=A0A7J5XRM3_DISMA|nr:hypothetical protein F7725_010496 [Dissostichus mawsoni]
MGKFQDVRSWRGCGEEEAMRKSVSPLPGNEGGSSASTTRVFGVPLEDVTRTHTLSGHEVPALVKHIVDYIEEHGHLDLEGLFLVNGNAERVDWLRQRYDSGEEVALQKEADLASAVSLLRLFLQELPEPVIPTAIQGHILQLHQGYLLQQLPLLNYGLLRFLCRFLTSVASLQQESWNIGTLAAVFGPDIFHLSTEGEDLRDQESVSRVLAELLDNQEGLFDSEEDDVSTTNDYSSINEQITELLDDEKCEAECEELPQDGEEGPASSDSPQNTTLTTAPQTGEKANSLQAEETAFSLKNLQEKSETKQKGQTTVRENSWGNENGLSHLSPISILPADSAQPPSTKTSAIMTAKVSLQIRVAMDSRINKLTLRTAPDPLDSGAALEESSGMDLDAEAVRDTENNINTARQDNQPCDNMEQTQIDIISCDPGSCRCDQNANTSNTNRNHLSPCQPNSGQKPQLQLFPDNQWEDPVPAFKSWQDEASFGSKEAMRGGDSVTHQLTKKLQHLKKKIKQFEEQFEKERNYKPSHGDKAANPKVLKWMTDLTKIRRQIKDAKHRAESELGPLTRPRSNTLPKSFGSTLDQGAHDAEVKDQHPTREETLELIQQRVKGKRQDDGWPDDIKKMTKEQLSCEKTVLQKTCCTTRGCTADLHPECCEEDEFKLLIKVTREERMVVKPLYDRYRLVKQMLTRVSITPITVSPSSKRRTQTLQPIIEGETAHFWEEIKEEEEDERKEKEEGGGEKVEREEEKEEEEDEEDEEEEGESSGGGCRVRGHHGRGPGDLV